jgi:hypothetical protein
MESKLYLIHVSEWFRKRFRVGHEDLANDSRSRWPSTAQHQETAANVHEMVTTK